jgi:hypothetical protein
MRSSSSVSDSSSSSLETTTGGVFFFLALERTQQRVVLGVELHRERSTRLVQLGATVALLERTGVADGLTIDTQGLRTAAAAGTDQLDDGGDAARDRRPLNTLLAQATRRRCDDSRAWQAQRQGRGRNSTW